MNVQFDLQTTGIWRTKFKNGSMFFELSNNPDYSRIMTQLCRTSCHPKLAFNELYAKYNAVDVQCIAIVNKDYAKQCLYACMQGTKSNMLLNDDFACNAIAARATYATHETMPEPTKSKPVKAEPKQPTVIDTTPLPGTTSKLAKAKQQVSEKRGTHSVTVTICRRFKYVVVNGKTYPGIDMAAAALNMDLVTLARRILSKGTKFATYSATNTATSAANISTEQRELMEMAAEKRTIRHASGKQGSKVRICINGHVYKSMSDAARSLSLPQSTVYNRVHSDKERWRDWVTID